MSSSGGSNASTSRDNVEQDVNMRARVQEVPPFVIEDGGEETELVKLNKILLAEGIKMNSLLTSSASASKFKKENMLKNCIKWMNMCCNIDDYYDFPEALNNLKLLIKVSTKFRELSGPVTHFLKTRFFARFFRYYITLEEGWECVELCAKHYKNSCGVYNDRLREAAASVFEKKIVSKAVAKAYALIPMTGDGGTDGILHSNKWNMQFEEVAKKCYNILRDLTKDINDTPLNIAETLPEDRYCSLETIDDELLYILFCNYCNVLRYMLLSAFPATKTLVPQQIFNIVFRCLNISRTAAGTSDSVRKMKVAERLPKFYIVAQSLLKALIMACRSNLLPFSYVIIRLISQTIQMTDVATVNECNDMSLMLRILAYDNWIKWINATNGAGAVLAGDISRSAYQDLNNRGLINMIDPHGMFEDEADHINRNRPDPDIVIRTHTLRKVLIITALNVLVTFTRVQGGVMSDMQLKEIHSFTINNVLKIQHATTLEFPFSEVKYRLALYSLLMELVNIRTAAWGSPLSWALDLFRQGIYDPDSTVANFCASALPNIQNIMDQDLIHPSSHP